MPRPRGLSVRLRLALSYAAVVMVAGIGILSVVVLFLLRYVPREAASFPDASDVNWVRFYPGRDDLIRAFVPPATWAVLFLLAFGLGGGWWLAGRMLAPLARITDATRRATAGSLSHRVALEGAQDEFRELADAFDGMLARIEAHVAEQGRFAANASHELRTPLAITQTLLDVAARDPARDPDDELIARLRAVNTRAIDLTEALLVLSRADSRTFEREPVDLSLAAEQAAETLLPLAERRGVALEVTADPATASGSPALLQQLATNLVHNAIVHNLPDGGTVRVRTAALPGSVVLSVENTGDPLDAMLVATLAEPFQRGAERVRSDVAGPDGSDHVGVGLGLAIARSIVAAHDGSLELAPRDDGGLRATVRLPRAV